MAKLPKNKKKRKEVDSEFALCLSISHRAAFPQQGFNQDISIRFHVFSTISMHFTDVCLTHLCGSVCCSSFSVISLSLQNSKRNDGVLKYLHIPT